MERYNTLIKNSNTRNRGVSETVEMLFLISALSLLVSLILLSYHSIFRSAEEQSAESTLQNVGAKIVRDIYSVYHLTIFPGDLNIKKRLEIPERVAGRTYMIILKPGELILEGKYKVTIPLSNKLPVANSSATSFNAYIVYSPDDGKIRVTNLE